MINDVHYTRTVDLLLKPVFEQRAFDTLPAVLAGLSNAQFRTAGHIIGERWMQSLSPADFWLVFQLLLRHDSKAFLVTLLKSLTARLPLHDVTLEDEGFARIVLLMSDIDKQKTLQNLLPVLTDVPQLENLFTRLGVGEPQQRIPYLVKVSTLPCAYMLFASLRYVEHDRPFLVRVARFLIKQGDTLSFNLASLIKAYFGLDEVRNTFSLQIKPFQLARIEQSYTAFCQAMRF